MQAHPTAGLPDPEPNAKEVKRREDRLRRLADREGFTLHKSRARTWTINNQCGYMIVDKWRNVIVAGERFDLDLDDVEAILRDSERS